MAKDLNTLLSASVGEVMQKLKRTVKSEINQNGFGFVREESDSAKEYPQFTPEISAFQGL